ncbi:fumarylacetoacetate hydrolase family protein [Mycolicibacterium goodii]|uniref:fumarylacetoacetate hydrolase family protein n=1 Tax=Mycolicibacterium goodii TaxID=134601 RepID=UPI001BDD7EB5|nr:fumarylacetoacetate hydrolase family protein [Mycolicibacterium goodii]MBU8809831.1 fumarylacetoacetate hydrolase family protein [Mycolicibacterium goodii]ULN49493.1 fumarylacetoacetate hydrolase family protein [Mycolicibacterium goodii]
MTELTWALAQYRTARGIEAGIYADDRIFAAQTFNGLTVMDMLAHWERWEDVLRTMDRAALTPVADAEVVAPLTYPSKVICAGANYYDHADEMGVDRPDPTAEPFFFLKTPTTTVVGPSCEVPIFDDGRSQVDWEAELGVVIGRRCADVAPEDAAQVIAGYLVANDVSDRGVFHRNGSVAAPFEWDWLGHKSQDGFCPLGPGLVPTWLVPDPQALKIRLDVNGVVKQDSDTSQMVVDVHRLIAAASRVFTLEPGDVILTGTPAGVGMPRKDFLRPDDVVTVEIEGIGRISNKVVAK